MPRFLAAMTLSLVLAPLIGASPAEETHYIIIQPGYPGSTAEAQGFLSDLSTALTKGGGPVNLQGSYHNDIKSALKAIAEEKPEFGMVSLGFYLAHRQDLHLKPFLESRPVQPFHLAVKKGNPLELKDLAGQVVAGTPFHEKEFVERILFGSGGSGPAADVSKWKVEVSEGFSKGIRDVARGNARAVLLTERERRAMEDLSAAKELVISHRTEEFPIALAVSFKDQSEPARKCAAALASLSKTPEWKALLSTMGIDSFAPVDEKRLGEIEERYGKSSDSPAAKADDRDVVFVVGHQSPDIDSVVSAVAYAALKNREGKKPHLAAIAGEVPPVAGYALERFHFPAPRRLADAAGRRLILVDHNDPLQALDRLKEAEVLEVVDHHAIGGLKTPGPIPFRVEPVGSTCTIIARMYEEEGVAPSKEMAGLLLAAIVGDTHLFRSPTSTEKDRKAAARLREICGADPAELYRELAARSFPSPKEIEALPAARIVRDDLKRYEMDGTPVAIGQFEVADAAGQKALAGRRAEVLAEMQKLRDSEKLALVVLMTTEDESLSTVFLVLGDERAVAAFEKTFGKLEDHAVRREGCSSRKLQVVPPLEKALAKK